MSFVKLKLAEFGAREELPPPTPVEKPIQSVAEQLATARDEAYARGFNDGVRTTTEALEGQAATLNSAVLEALQDADLTQHAARSAAFATLAPILQRLAESVLPAVAAQTFPELVLEQVQQLAANRSEPDIRIEVHSSQSDAVAQAIETAGLRIPVVAVDHLQRLEVRLHHDSGFERRDVEASLAAIERAVSAHFHSQLGGSDERRTA